MKIRCFTFSRIQKYSGSFLYYTFIEFIILLYTFLVVFFTGYKEYMIFLTSFNKLSDVLPTFTCARAIGNLCCIYLAVINLKGISKFEGRLFPSVFFLGNIPF